MISYTQTALECNKVAASPLLTLKVKVKFQELCVHGRASTSLGALCCLVTTLVYLFIYFLAFSKWRRSVLRADILYALVMLRKSKEILQAKHTRFKLF